MQYQLRSIVDGQPVSARVFNLEQLILEMESISNATAFAITLEPTGGSMSPTLDKMYVIGQCRGTYFTPPEVK